jgi:hypothetical protein
MRRWFPIVLTLTLVVGIISVYVATAPPPTPVAWWDAWRTMGGMIMLAVYVVGPFAMVLALVCFVAGIFANANARAMRRELDRRDEYVLQRRYGRKQP